MKSRVPNLAASIKHYNNVSTANRQRSKERLNLNFLNNRLGTNPNGPNRGAQLLLGTLVVAATLLPHQITAVALYGILRLIAMGRERLSIHQVNSKFKKENDQATLQAEVAKLPIEVGARLAQKSKVVRKNLSEETRVELAQHNLKQASSHWLAPGKASELIAIAAITLSFPINKLVRADHTPEHIQGGIAALALFTVLSLTLYAGKFVVEKAQRNAAQRELDQLQ